MHKIDVTKGEMKGDVSRQWANRTPDQRFTSLTELRAQVAQWADESFAKDITPGAMLVKPTEDNDLALHYGDAAPMGLTNYAFQQLSRLAGAPGYYLKDLPAPLAAINLNYGLKAAAQKDQSLYIRNPSPSFDGGAAVPIPNASHLRGITSPRYGRIYDRDVVDAVIKVAGNGTGDTRWKVPGTIDWANAHGVSYNPNVVITKENTTLYASDRDVFIFLVDDMHPIEVGKLNDGSPDLMFRGFYVWNSEVGDKTFGVATMYLRGVCQNRNLWGVEGFNELTFKHTAGAPNRFMDQAAPALQTFSDGSTTKLIAGVKAAKEAKVSKTDEERIEFLAKWGFSEKQAKELIATAVAEESRPQESIWDHAQAITAHARKSPLQENRLAMEQTAGKMLDKVKA
ncbi:hypothetical protein UFOVP233_26 [uncultured Caudovirales phage]|uniref:DUF932 domain-containing protein n=1 Tax=uncultured Caudovirales phage TaxID=2100421 RepID=A0A6J7WR46_9CAUD|nr:hypothetical protein UFOVP233_26 [uncultured Caudovirales phage]